MNNPMDKRFLGADPAVYHEKSANSSTPIFDTKTLDAVKALRQEGYSLTTIANLMGINRNTLKSQCRRYDIPVAKKRKTKAESQNIQLCKFCWKPVKRTTKREKAFCSDLCRTRYWRCVYDEKEAQNIAAKNYGNGEKSAGLIAQEEGLINVPAADSGVKVKGGGLGS